MSTFDSGPPPPPPPPGDAPPPPPPSDGPLPPPPPPDEPPGGPPGPPPDDFPTSAMPPVGGPPPVAAASTTPDWVKPVAIAAAIALIIALIVAVTSGGDDKNKQAAGGTGGGEIFLQPISEPGPDSFGPNVAAPLPPNTIPPSTLATTPTTVAGGKLAITARSGAARGLYGGTKDQSTCDKQGMIDFLNQNPSKKAAWAQVQGISTSDVPAYIDSLASVVLRDDTRVTNHGYKNGKPTSFHAILQAGTAVLVDNRGVPRARCACGNPLTPPVAVPTTPVYKGDPWTGFSPTNITVINQSTTIINNITVINIVTGDTINVTINNFTPGGGTGNTSPPTTGTRPPTTIGGGGGVGAFHLTHVEPQINDPSRWTVDGAAGTAHGDYNPNFGDYRWTAWQTIPASGTQVDFGGRATNNLAININVYIDSGEAVLTPANDDERAVGCYDAANGCNAEKTATLTVKSGTQKFVLKFAMGYAVTVLYTYER